MIRARARREQALEQNRHQASGKREEGREASEQEGLALAGGKIIDYVQMAENLLQSRQRQRAAQFMGNTTTGPERTCKHHRRVFKVKFREADGDR